MKSGIKIAHNNAIYLGSKKRRSLVVPLFAAGLANVSKTSSDAAVDQRLVVRGSNGC